MDSHYEKSWQLPSYDLSSQPVEDLVLKFKYAATPEEHLANFNAAIALGLPSLQKGELTSEPIAVVCSGPSLKATRREVRHFNKILTCSGAHKYLIDHGLVPTWHMEGDPREHKAVFVKHPHKRVQYLIASSCHPAMFKNLKGYDVRIWHSLQGAHHLLTLDHYPPGDWVLTGGTNVGMRALVMARLLGFTNVHVFGMDCSAEETMHTGDHPNEAPKSKFITVQVGDQEFKTTHLFLAYAKQFFHEVIQLPDVNFTLHGEGLLQALTALKLTDPDQLKEFMDKRENVVETTIAVVQRPQVGPVEGTFEITV